MFKRSLAASLLVFCGSVFVSRHAECRPLTREEMSRMFDAALREGRVGKAKKRRMVDARPAESGEVVVTIIRGEGEETRSKPANVGDMVVRNRCSETGHEEILVTREKFVERYEGPVDDPSVAQVGNWNAYRPRGSEMWFFTVGEEQSQFSFIAPWGAEMVASPGDAIVRNPSDPSDIYRIAAAAFSCTYEVLQEPGNLR